MTSIKRVSSQTPASLLRVSTIIITCLSICLITSTDAAPALTEEEILANYRPLAMDESWKLVGPKRSSRHGYEPSELYTNHLSSSSSSSSPHQNGRVAKTYGTIDGQAASDIVALDQMSPKTYDSFERRADVLPTKVTDSLADVSEWSPKNSDQLYVLPPDSSFSSDVITTNKEQPTTFLSPEVLLPVRTEGLQTNSSADSSKVIARYRIILPIFIPALRRKSHITTAKPIKYVKEVVTEMVPIKQNVPHVKEIVKAEKMPQSLVTDFVSTDRSKLPQNIDDKLRPNEQLLSSVVQNVD